MNYQPEYSSLTNSIIQTPKRTHTRVQSYQKLCMAPPQTQPEYTRIPSQKRLTITSSSSNNNEACFQFFQKEGAVGIKKKGIESRQVKSKFTSLESSYIQSLNQPKQSQDNLKIKMQNLQNQFRQKFLNLKNHYQKATKDNQHQIYQLQKRISHISKQLDLKNKKILQLQEHIIAKRQKESQFYTKISQNIMVMINDCDVKIRTLGEYYQECQMNNQNMYENLTRGVISFFGKKMNRIEEQSRRFIQKFMLHLMTMQIKMKEQEKLKVLNEKCIIPKQRLDLMEKKQGKALDTRQSIESIPQQQSCQQISTIHDQGISFWDDCFFYPNQKSQNCNLLIDMFNRRGQALALWTDNQTYLHYCDSGSFLYNRKGEKMKVIQQELNYLVQGHIIKLY